MIRLQKDILKIFLNSEQQFPVIATTSKLMSTGTDAQTCKVICLDENIGSMTEFAEEVYGNENFEGYELGEDTPPYVPKPKFFVNDVDVSILSERKQYLDADGHLITTSVKEYCKTGILTSYRSLDNFLQTWNNAEKKSVIIEELEAEIYSAA